MLMLDPYYRTLKGFQILLEQEWFSFGHKFADRSGWTVHGWKDEDRSPIFEQFLHCTYLLMNQKPSAFEFNEDFLLFLVENTHNGLFGNFLANSELERRPLIDKEFSIWMYVDHNLEYFRNAQFKSKSKKILIPTV